MALTARELCETVENKLKGTWVEGQTIADVWGNEELSDHLPREWISNTGQVAVVTWNVLDFSYVSYMTSEKDGGQGLHNHPMIDPDVQKSRLKLIVEWVVQMLHSNYIVCLQEASNELRDMLKAAIPYTCAMHRTRIDEEDSNQLLVIYDGRIYQTLSEHELWGPGVGHERFVTNYWTFQARAFSRHGKFNLANVHLSWKTNEMCRHRCEEVFLKDPEQLPAIVCGDFNAGCRLPAGSQIEGDHILQVYDDPAFKFAPPPAADKGPPYSHVNCAKNVTGPDRQLDMFDHIMLMNGAEKYL